MEPFSALLAVCEGNSPVIGEFPAQRPVTRSFDVFFNLRLNKRLNNQDNTQVILYSVHASLCVALVVYKQFSHGLQIKPDKYREMNQTNPLLTVASLGQSGTNPNIDK